MQNKNIQQKPKAILFDWDNTLVDTSDVIYSALSHTFVSMGMEPWSKEDIKNNRGNIHHSLRSSFPRIFKDRWEEAREIYFGHFRANHLEKLKILPGADKTIELIAESEVYMAIVSNKTGIHLRNEVEHLGWSAYFKKIVGATDTHEDKPSAVPIHHALEGSGIEAGENVWMVGDSEADIEAAKNAGCTPVLFGRDHISLNITINENDLITHKNHNDLHKHYSTLIIN